ncbi:G2/mitotic-specific cyclin-B3 [Biomphalaria glabrata]|nr:G2/mitotic-specific cyclin-B3 [Biomphalaria glabrata]
MFTRKKINENIGPQQSKPLATKKVMEGPVKGGQAKIKRAIPTKRAAFGDITNATKEKPDDLKKIPLAVKPLAAKPLIGKIHPTIGNNAKNTKITSKIKTDLKNKANTATNHAADLQENSISRSQALKNLAAGVPEDRVEEDFSFVIVEDSLEEKLQEESDKTILDIDQELYTDVFNVGLYAQDIFDYYRRRENMFIIPPYLDRQSTISAGMRAILVDWMVEVQESFELNHETLYLAVKLTDIYLSRITVNKEMLQLIGASAIFVSSKFDERCPPLIEDFIYICDNAFDKDEFIQMEMELLRKVNFDLGVPISYRFLRRYSKVARLSIETLTLARFILEMSLMEYDLVKEKDSKVAAAALYIAMKMRKEGVWQGDLVKSSHYKVDDFKHLIVALNKMLLSPAVPQLNTIRSKYSHVVFHEVAKIPLMPTEELFNTKSGTNDCS